MTIKGSIYIPVSVAAKRMNFSTSHMRRLALEGAIGFYRFGERGWMYLCEDDVNALISVNLRVSNKEGELYD